MRRIRAVAAIGILLAAMVVGTTAPAYAAPAKPDFASQAHNAGLTGAEAASLQKRVDTYLTRSGGTQVAINKIDLDGKGEILLALPGENRAREAGAASPAGAAIFECLVGNFCGYSGQNYTGDILRYFYCSYKLSMPFVGFGSFKNNQTSGASAHFYDDNGTYMYDSLAAPLNAPTMQWTYIYWIKPCGAI